MDQARDDTAPAQVQETASALQWLRELMTVAISVVILVLTAVMLWGTYDYASENPSSADANARAARTEAFNQQKDILLYGLALLGTVTGYYLGRGPAELRAQQAQRSANVAQAELQKAQTKLTDTAGNAAVVGAQLTVAHEQKNAAKERLSEATEALEVAGQAISRTLHGREQKAVLDEDPAVEQLRDAKERIDTVLRHNRLRST